MAQAEVNQRMIAAGLAGKTVVRLKAGDPSLFGAVPRKPRAWWRPDSNTRWFRV